MELFRHGVVAVTSPRMATQDASASQIEPFEGAVFLDGLDCVLRAGGGKAARRWEHGRNGHAIEVDGEQQQPREYFHKRSVILMSAFFMLFSTARKVGSVSVMHTKASTKRKSFSANASQRMCLFSR